MGYKVDKNTKNCKLMKNIVNIITSVIAITIAQFITR